MTGKVDNYFFDTFLGSGSAVRLGMAACDWFEEITGRTQFLFLNQVAVNTEAFSKTFLKPLDESTKIISALKGCTKLWKEGITTMTVAKTLKDSCSALKCLSQFGFVILTPYGKAFNHGKNTLGIGVGVWEMKDKVAHIWRLCSVRPKSLEEQQHLSAKKYQAWFMLGMHFSLTFLSLNGLLEDTVGAFMDPKDRMPKAAVMFFGTASTIASIAGETIGHYYLNRNS